MESNGGIHYVQSTCRLKPYRYKYLQWEVQVGRVYRHEFKLPKIQLRQFQNTNWDSRGYVTVNLSSPGHTPHTKLQPISIIASSNGGSYVYVVLFYSMFGTARDVPSFVFASLELDMQLQIAHGQPEPIVDTMP